MDVAPGAVNLRSYTQGLLSEITESAFQNNKLRERGARIAASSYASGKKAGQWQIMGWEAKHDFVNDVLTRLRMMRICRKNGLTNLYKKEP